MRTRLLLLLAGLALATAPLSIVASARGAAQAAPAAYDLVIARGRIVDGTGAPWFVGDVGVLGDRIAAIGDLSRASARTRIDASGLVVAPGFIDMLGQSEFNVLVDNRAASKIMQGITTEITGEGASIAPLNDRMIADATADATSTSASRRTGARSAEYFKRLEERVAPGDQHRARSSARAACATYVIGKDDRPATPAELEQMKELVAQAMEDGALGRQLVAAVRARPLRHAPTNSSRWRRWPRATAASTSPTSDRSPAASSSRSTRCSRSPNGRRIPAEIWHLKTAYRANWGKMPEVLRPDRGRARREASTSRANKYPYNRASNGLDACLPLWVREGGTRRDAGAAEGPGAARAHQAGDGRPERAGWENQWYGSGGGDGVMLVVGARTRRCGSTRG